MKWLLTAEYGGTGGKNLEGGMVLEEPDIEIGAGVSSKAMSKRVLPESGPVGANKRQHRDEQRNGGNGGNGGNRDRRRYEGNGGYGGAGYGGQPVPPQPVQMEHYGYARQPEPVAVATPPAVPGFGFALPGAGQGGYR
jgi:protein NRD1